MPGARVSVVIPVFNGERFITEAIESCLMQTLPPAEVIVVDDGSSDRSSAAVESFGPPVQLIRTPRRGISEARNTGLAHSTSELIAFLDADDRMTPYRLEHQVAALEKPPGADFVLGRAEVRVENGAELPAFTAAKLAPVAEGRGGYWAMTLLARREAFERVGPFEPGMRIGQDADWLMRAFEAELPYALLDDPMIERRFHGDNITYDTEGSRHAGFEILRRRAARHRARSG